MDNKICFEKLGIMADCSRNSVMSVSSIKKLIKLLAAMGYNTLQLYTEDTYEVEDEPYFGYLRGKFTPSELKEIDAYAIENNIELIPCIQTLAHLNQIFRWEPYREICDFHNILLVDEPRTYRLIENMFKTLAKCFTSRRVNIGMDEARMIGLGQYLKRNGFKNRFDIMTGHLAKVNEIANKYGFTCSMWSDMFFRIAFGGDYYAMEGDFPENVKEKIPNNVTLIYWDYYHLQKSQYDKMLCQHEKLSDRITFAGGAWIWRGLAPFNRYSIKATKAAFEACREHGIKEAFLTLWGDNGGSCSPFSALPTLFTASEFAKGNFDETEIKRGFEKLFGIPFDVFMCADIPNILSDGQPADKVVNPSKYLLYNDCLMGIFDPTIEEGIGEIYADRAARLKEAEKYGDWSFIFRPLRLLCEVLSYKADLGIKTRAAYAKKDKEAIARLIEREYNPLLEKLSEFYGAFSEYWDKLFKPHGFEVMDYRIGGLMQRIKHIIKKLSRYVSGETDAVPELEECLLDFFGGGETYSKKLTEFNNFANNITANIL